MAALRPGSLSREIMSAEAIDYVKKPAIDFIKESWKLMRRCTKPDRNGALRPSLAPEALGASSDRSSNTVLVLCHRLDHCLGTVLQRLPVPHLAGAIARRSRDSSIQIALCRKVAHFGALFWDICPSGYPLVVCQLMCHPNCSCSSGCELRPQSSRR